MAVARQRHICGRKISLFGYLLEYWLDGGSIYFETSNPALSAMIVDGNFIFTQWWHSDGSSPTCCQELSAAQFSVGSKWRGMQQLHAKRLSLVLN